MKMRPTLLVGLGGQGRAILENVKSRLQELGASALLEGPLGFLFIDTAADGWQDIPPHEKVHASVEDVPTLLETPPFPIENWWQEPQEPLSQLGAGTLGQRCYGRLAFFKHFENLRTRFDAAHARIRDPQIVFSSSLQVDLEQPTDVFLVASTGGGTGGGILLDLALLLKQQFRGHGINLQAFLLGPSADSQEGAANTYALLKEINHFSYGASTELEWSRGQKLPLPPFDSCYLMLTPPTPDGFARTVLAESIITDLVEGELSDAKRNLRVNLKQYNSRVFDVEHGNFSQQFICRYSSLGQTVWRVPYKELRSVAALQLAQDLVRSWFRPNAPWAPGLSELVSSLGLESGQLQHGSGMLDHLIYGDRPGDLQQRLKMWAQEWTHALNAPANPAFDPLDALEQSAHNLEQQLIPAKEMARRSEHLYREGVLNIEAYITTQIDCLGLETDQIMETVVNLESSLETSILALQRQLTSTAERQREQANQAVRILAEMRRVKHRHNWDGRRASIRKNLQSQYFKASIDFGTDPGWLACWARERAAFEALEISRKLLRYLREELKSRLETLKGFLHATDAKLQELLERELHSLNEPGNALDWQAISAQIYTRLGQPRLGEIRTAIGRSQDSGLLTEQREDLAAILVDACSPAFAQVDSEFSPVRILVEHLGERERVEMMSKLTTQSRPWIQGRQQSHLFALHESQTQRLIGLPTPDKNAEALERDSFSRALLTLKESISSKIPESFGFTSIEKSDRIVVYQECAGFPLNYLHGLQSAREQYIQRALAGESPHVFAEIDPTQDFLVYTPAELKGVQAAMRCFVLASLFNTISFRQGRYHFAGEPASLPLDTREKLMHYLARQSELRDKLLLVAEGRFEEVAASSDSQRVAFLGGLVAQQKRAVYGAKWGKVASPAELAPWERLEVSVLSLLEETLEAKLATHRLSPSAMQKIVEGLSESLASRTWLREDGRYSLDESLTSQC